MMNHHERALRWTYRFGWVTATAALVGGLAGCGPDGPDAPGARAALFDEDASGAVLQPGDSVVLTATEFEFSPNELVAEPGAYTGEVVNDGAIAHNLTLSSGESFDLGPGETVAIDFILPDGGLTFVCAIAGHEDAGMTGEISTRAPADDDPDEDR
jgi:plastocyanin